MVMALSLDHAKENQVKIKGDGSGTVGETLFTGFFGSPKTPNFPHAGLSQRAPGRSSRAHFHTVDQFQVVVGGKGKIGRHNLAPYSVHFSRAYTPYGPLLTDNKEGLTFFFLRAQPDPEPPHRMPENQGRLRQISDRIPWQITSLVTFPSALSTTMFADLQEVRGIKDENGLAAYTLSMKPNAHAYAPDPIHGDGQYIVVVKGSLLHDEQEHNALALVFIKPQEGPLRVHAGAAGLAAIVLNFPQRQMHAANALASVTNTPGFESYQCSLCSFVYNESAGLPEEGITPGTLWKDVRDIWTCPDCNASKADFTMIKSRS